MNFDLKRLFGYALISLSLLSFTSACGGGKELVYCENGVCSEVEDEDDANFRCDLDGNVYRDCESVDLRSRVGNTSAQDSNSEVNEKSNNSN